ncbi:MAG TPA: hypothetical protein VJR92_04555 [Gemmatimonadaceae bacterium]|nr:hypothetical protein [Gemmatimonadaceae bacterium]
MSDAHLRARSVSEIVDGAMVLYRKHAGTYMLATALGLAPLVILQLLFPGTETLLNDESADLSAIGTAAITSLLLAVVAAVTYAAIGGVLMVMASRAYLGGAPDIRDAVRVTLPRVPALVGATIMKGILWGIGVLMLLVGFFWFLARYFGVEQAILLEGKGMNDSFGRSAVLAKGRIWHILLVMLLIGIVYIVLFVCAGLAAAMVPSRALQLVISNVASVIALPAWQIAMVVLYYDARIRSEGFDLEHMAASLDSAPARG